MTLPVKGHGVHHAVFTGVGLVERGLEADVGEVASEASSDGLVAVEEDPHLHLALTPFEHRGERVDSRLAARHRRRSCATDGTAHRKQLCSLGIERRPASAGGYGCE